MTADQTLTDLAIAYSLELRAEHDADRGWAIWAWCPLSETRDDADIAGSGEKIGRASCRERV